MANLLLTLLIVGVFTIVHSQAQSFTSFFERSNSYYDSISNELTVFQKGRFQVTKPIKVGKTEYSAPEPLLIYSPKEEGEYPVLFFIHGTMIPPEDYSEFFKYIASHGFIVVAPQLFRAFPPRLPSQQEEIDRAASVANWLPSNLPKVLRKIKVAGVEGNFDKLAISGHSRGGKSAFALALGKTENTSLSIKISALIGIDPVAGESKNRRTDPKILTYKRDSLDLAIPVTVIGTGLGNGTIACAPYDVSHQQFFDECKKSSHFVIKKYGHMDMLNDFLYPWDTIALSMSVICKPSFQPKAKMRRTLGGIMVAFLNNHFRHDGGQYHALIANPFLAPTKLFVQTKKGNFGFAPAYYAQAA